MNTTKVTIIKYYRNKQTLRLMPLQEVVDSIRNCQYKNEVEELRRVFPLIKGKRGADGTLTAWTQFTKQLPRICFALSMNTTGQNRLIRDYSGLVLLEVNNLTGQDEAEAVRRGAAEMPQTLLAFVGADGQSVKIVCRGELFPSDGGGLPTDMDGVRDFHQNLYERARLIYNGQLGVTIEKLEPLPERICYMATDSQVVYNSLATPIYAHAEKVKDGKQLQASSPQDRNSVTPDHLVSMRTAYEFNLTKALDDAEGISDGDELRHTVLTRLAEY